MLRTGLQAMYHYLHSCLYVAAAFLLIHNRSQWVRGAFRYCSSKSKVAIGLNPSVERGADAPKLSTSTPFLHPLSTVSQSPFKGPRSAKPCTCAKLDDFGARHPLSTWCKMAKHALLLIAKEFLKTLVRLSSTRQTHHSRVAARAQLGHPHDRSSSLDR